MFDDVGDAAESSNIFPRLLVETYDDQLQQSATVPAHIEPLN